MVESLNVRTALTLILAATASAPALAHGSTCVTYNDATPNVSSTLTTTPPPGTNPNQHAYRFVLPNNVFPQSGWVFTGSPQRFDYMRIELWTDVGGAPGSRIVSGTMASPQSASARWLGTNFESLTMLTANTPYWFVWVEPGESILAEEPGGADVMPRFRRAGSGAWSPAGSGTPKFRLFCGDSIESKNVLRIGSPCASSLGTWPYAWSNHEPAVGNSEFAVEGVHLPPGSQTWLLLGLDPSFLAVDLQPLIGTPAGCILYVDGAVSWTTDSGVAEIGDLPAVPRPRPAGHVRFPIPIPNDPGISGFTFLAQIVASDPPSSAAVPLIFSNALLILVP